MRSPSAQMQFFSPGEEIPRSGIYVVKHHGHHHDHEVTCLSGERFPECRDCKRKVRFSLVVAARAIKRHTHFQPLSDDGLDVRSAT
jgi:YjzC-like protein